MSQAWLSIVEYARAFNMSDMTVRRRIKTGKIVSELRDGKYYIPVNMGQNGEFVKIARNPHINEASDQNSDYAQATLTSPKSGITQPRPVHLQSSPKLNIEQKQPHVHKQPEPVTQKNISVDAQNLINLCNNIISETKKKENIINSRYQAQINALTNELHVKDLELKQVQQQLEDLQLLVQVLEKK